jgi:hypothetical protein
MARMSNNEVRDLAKAINRTPRYVSVWRALTGHAMDGEFKTDATWLHRGTRSTRKDGRAASRWHYLSRIERMGVRWGSAAGTGALGYAYVADPETTAQAVEWSGFGLGMTGAAYAGYRMTDRVITWRHYRDWVWPLHVALYKKLGYPEGTKPSRYLRIPVNFDEITGEAVRIELPADFAGGEEKSGVTGVLREKLALQDVSFSWKLDGRNHYVVVTQAPRPPGKVLFDDAEVRAKVEKAPESAPLIGLSHRGTVVSVDLDAESPHVLVSAGTGGGKSVILRGIFSQQLHNGGQGTVLDRKRHSHKWARGIPGVTYCREIEDIHDELVRLGAEGERRNRIVDEWEGDDKEAPVGPRHTILLEEANATIGKLKRYWAKIREKEDPKESPAIDALGEVLFMGRAVKMHVLLVAQSATANALGGPEMRENFATRILARYTQNAWKMLVPEVSPAPKSTRHIGRAQVVLGGVAHETQVLFMTDADARAWAMEGRTAAVPPTTVPLPRQAPVTASQGLTHPVDLVKQPATVAGSADARPVRHLAVVPNVADQAPDPDALVSLRKAVDGGILPNTTLAAARKARERDPEFPTPEAKRGQTDMYRPSELQKWERNRPGAKSETGTE